VDTAHDAGLGASVQRQLVEVQRRALLLPKGALSLKHSKVFFRLGVDQRVMRIGIGRKIDVGTRDVEKAQGIACRERRRLGAGDDIIRRGGDARDDLGLGTPGAERS
jgi:hypothetical protein